MSYYRTYIAPFLRGICKDHYDRNHKESPMVMNLDSDVIDKYLYLIMDLKEEGFLNIDTSIIEDNFKIYLRSGSREDSQIVVDSLRDAFLDKFLSSMQRFLDEEWNCEMEEVESERLYGLGYTTTVDKETGERIWTAPKNVGLTD